VHSIVYSNLETDSPSHDQENNQPTPYIPEPNQFYWTTADHNTESILPHSGNPVCAHTDDQEQSPHSYPPGPTHSDDQHQSALPTPYDDSQVTEEANYNSYSFSNNNVGIILLLCYILFIRKFKFNLLNLINEIIIKLMLNIVFTALRPNDYFAPYLDKN
jgi:hypothetical protein